MIPVLPLVRPNAETRYEAALARHMSLLAALPEAYKNLPEAERVPRTRKALETLGENVLLLVHNYQADEIVRWADHTGDSYQLSALAAKDHRAKHIVFCGVTFMAETADLLTDGKRNVIMPSMEASCPMAGMAEMVQVARGWDLLSKATDVDRVVPVTYMNSYADLKAFTGEHGGLVCTSSNSIKAFKWAFERGDKILFLPDQHLGENTARWLGIPEQEIVTFNPWKRDGIGGLTPEEVAGARVILWQGFCQVHERFTVDHVNEMRRDYPGVRVIVHPECRREVVEAADAHGSTARIIDWVKSQPPGTKIAVGTEIHMVKRLAKENPDKTIVQLCGPLCLDCNAMRQVNPDYLLWVLEELAYNGRVVNPIRVDDADREWAKVALQRMLDL